MSFEVIVCVIYIDVNVFAYHCCLILSIWCWCFCIPLLSDIINLMLARPFTFLHQCLCWLHCFTWSLFYPMIVLVMSYIESLFSDFIHLRQWKPRQSFIRFILSNLRVDKKIFLSYKTWITELSMLHRPRSRTRSRKVVLSLVFSTSLSAGNVLEGEIDLPE